MYLRLLLLTTVLLGVLSAVFIPRPATAYEPALGVFWLSPTTDLDPPTWLTYLTDGWHGSYPASGAALDFASRNSPADLGAYARGWTFTQTPNGAPSIRFWSATSDVFQPLGPACTIVWQDIYDAFGWPEVASQWVASVGYMHTGNRSTSMFKHYLAYQSDGTPYGAYGYSPAEGEQDRVATQIANPACCRGDGTGCWSGYHVHSFVLPGLIGHSYAKNPAVPNSPDPPTPELVGTWGWSDEFLVGQWAPMPYP